MKYAQHAPGQVRRTDLNGGNINPSTHYSGTTGKHRNGLSRFRCPACKRTFTEPHERVLGNMTTSEASIILALQLLVEGNSIRSTMRITGLDQNTIMKALVLAGEKCEKLMGRLI